MNNRTTLSLALIALTLLFVGCGNSPNAKIFILNAMDRDASLPTLKVDGHSVAVKVGPISIPDTLDQSPIVTRTGKNTLVVDEFNRWSGDFQSDIQRVLGENISILLAMDQVSLSQEIILQAIDFQVIVNIREFDGTLGGRVLLNADWIVARKGKNKSVTAKKSVLEESTVGADYQAYVAAQSRLLAKLSEEISAEICRQLKQ